MRYTMVYDADCGPCTRFRDAVSFLDSRHRMEYTGINEAEGAGLLDALPLSARHRSFHLVFPDGRVVSGADALPGLTGLLPGGSVPSFLLGSSTVVFSAAAFVYSVFARLHETGSCSYVRRTEL